LVAATHHRHRQQRYQRYQQHRPPRLAHPRHDATSSSLTILHLSIPRGGGGDNNILSIASTAFNTVTSTPGGVFNVALAVLGVSAAVLKLAPTMTTKKTSSNRSRKDDATTAATTTTKIISLQRRFLIVFWLLRMSDWLQGPYFYQVYASKTATSSLSSSASSTAVSWVSRLFLTGFASTAIFGPFVGRACDTYGRKAGTIAFTVLYSISALSTRSDILVLLLLGRIVGGIGTSLLFSAPESWLVGEYTNTIPTTNSDSSNGLGEIFSLAYAGDSIVAIIAGQLAGLAASYRGPTGPFELSVLFLGLGGLLASLLWTENIANSSGSGGDSRSGGNSEDGEEGGGMSMSTIMDDEVKQQKPTIRDAIHVVKSDPKIILVGAIQSMFEAAMYIFVLNWPPAVSSAITSYFKKFVAAATTTSSAATVAISTPYGTVFSCFMACCLLGSTIFGRLTTAATSNDTNTKKKVAISIESFTVGMLTVATTAMGIATLSIGTTTTSTTSAAAPVALLIQKYMSTISNTITTTPGALLVILISSLFIFECTVGMYFPTIGTLRSTYFPNSHRSVIMNLFGIPLNIMVMTVFLSIETLGVRGALGISTLALSVATLCGIKLKSLIEGERQEEGVAAAAAAAAAAQ
jgi:MFS family permease